MFDYGNDRIKFDHSNNTIVCILNYWCFMIVE